MAVFTWGPPRPSPLPHYEARCRLFLSDEDLVRVLEKASHYPPHVRGTFFYMTWLAIESTLVSEDS